MDVSEYRRASRAVWEAMAAGWDARHADLEEQGRPVTERMLSVLEPRPGETLLELAAGTGIVGFAAARLVGRRGRVIMSDFAEAMVALARGRGGDLGLENLDYRVLDAERLDLSDASIDGVLCRWGYMLMGDPSAAVAETRRVLAPGGRAVCAVFAEAARNPWASVAGGLLVERGAMQPPAPGTPGIFALSDPNRLERLFAQAGLGTVHVDEVAFEFRFADADDYWEFLTEAAGAISIVLTRLGADGRRGFRAALPAVLEPFGEGSGHRFPAVCLVARAA